jgi:hypothetical protein
MTTREDCIEALDEAMKYRPTPMSTYKDAILYYMLRALVYALLYIGEQIKEK